MSKISRRKLVTSGLAATAGVSGLAAAGLEALLNTLVEPGDRVAIGGGGAFLAETADIASRYGADVFSGTTFGFACVKATAGLLSQNPTLYLAWPSLENLIWGTAFFGSAPTRTVSSNSWAAVPSVDSASAS